MIVNYFYVIRKNAQDYIPKIVITLLVQKTIDEAEQTIVGKLFYEDEMAKVLKPSAEATDRLAFLDDETKIIKEAIKVFNSYI